MNGLKYLLMAAMTSGCVMTGMGGEMTKISFNAEQSTGGTRVETDKKVAAVMLNAAADVKQQVVWKAEPAIPAGLWQVDVEFFLGDKAHRAVYLEFEAGCRSRFDMYTLPGSPKTFNFHAGYYSAQPTTAVILRKVSQRNLDTLAVANMVFSPLTEAGLAKLPLCLMPAVKNGKVELPFALPGGSYQVRSATAVKLKWTAKDGKSFQTPRSNTVFVALQGGEEIEVVEGKIAQLIMERNLPIGVPEMKAGDAPLIKVTDNNRMQNQTLVMKDYKGKELPRLTLFPGDRKMAFVTTWDDGKEADLLLMKMLNEYGVKATLFMNHHSALIGKMKDLEALGAEIGSHSWTHPWYHLSSPERCRAESVEMRRFLEQQVGHPVISFAYPFGYAAAYDVQGDYVLRSLREAGYWAGRTTTVGDNTIDQIAEPLALRTNGHFLQGANKIKTKLDELKKKPGSIMYIWGHSYELAGKGQAQLEEVLKIVGKQPDLWYATQGDLMVWQWLRKETKIAAGAPAADGSATATLSRPWLHPWLNKIPVTVQVPAGVKEVVWDGKTLAVVDGKVDLVWNEK